MTFDPVAAGAECSRCPLSSKTPVPPQPNPNPKLIIVGMAPGRMEERASVPFFGPSGKMLDRCLEEAGFDRTDAWVTNSVLCRPEEDRDMKRAVACCAPRLANELRGFDEKIPILALGAEATRAVLGKAGVMRSRGFIWRAPEIKESSIRSASRTLEKRIATKKDPEKIEASRDSLALLSSRQTYSNRVVIPSIHPAFVLRGADSWLPVLRIDIGRAVRWALQGGLPLVDENVPFTKTNDPILAKKLLDQMGDLVCVDIETVNTGLFAGVKKFAEPMSVKLTCVGIADVGHIEKWVKGKIKKLDRRRIVVLDPWKNELVPVLRLALRNRDVLTHNGPAFDEIALAARRIYYKRRKDTLIAHYAYASEKPKSLAFVASIYNDSGPWKTRFKEGSEEKGVAGLGVKKEDLALYNAADILEDSLAWIRMQPDLANEMAVYEHDIRHARLCQKLQINGLLVDQARKKELSKKLRYRSAALLGEMRELLGRRSFSPSKPNDIRKALFTQLKAPTYLAPLTPTGLPAANAVVLEALKGGHNRAAKLADLIIRWRSANDSRIEYLDNVKIHADGRVHCHWRSYGTETGRAATRNPNILNITKMQRCPGCGLQLIDGMIHKETCKPKKRKEPQPEDQLRDIYIASPGHMFIYFDLSQCFTPGTLVDTPTGAKPIESLKLGDLVFTYRDRRPAVGKVTQSVRLLRRHVVKVTLDNGKEIRCTPDHKWLVCPERQDDDPIPCRADALQPGDRLLPFRKVINKRDGRELLYAHKAIEYSKTHIEVARAALGDRPDGYDVHHKDEDCTNNDPSNLEYKLAFKHKSDHGKEVAARGWGTLSIRKRMLKGIRKHIAEHDWSGENNPRFGDRRRRMNSICGYCKKAFEYFRTQGNGKFCSRKCYTAGKAWPRPPCAVCRKIMRRPSMLFCGRRCAKIGLEKGLNHKVVSVVLDGVSDVWSIAVSPDHNYALAAGVFVNNCEMRFAANLSGDEAFIKACETDIHTGNARLLFRAVPGALEDLKDPKGAGFRFRDLAKKCGFCISYLGEAEKLFKTLLENGFDVEIDVCQDAIDAIHSTYWRYFQYVDENVALCQKQGYLRTAFLGRKRWLGFHPKPTEVSAFPISAGVADIMNKRLGIIDGRMPKRVKQVMYQYDSAIYETPENLVDKQMAIIKDVWSEKIWVPDNGIEFMQPIEAKTGRRLSDFG